MAWGRIGGKQAARCEVSRACSHLHLAGCVRRLTDAERGVVGPVLRRQGRDQQQRLLQEFTAGIRIGDVSLPAPPGPGPCRSRPAPSRCAPPTPAGEEGEGDTCQSCAEGAPWARHVAVGMLCEVSRTCRSGEKRSYTLWLARVCTSASSGSREPLGLAAAFCARASTRTALTGYCRDQHNNKRRDYLRNSQPRLRLRLRPSEVLMYRRAARSVSMAARRAASASAAALAAAAARRAFSASTSFCTEAMNSRACDPEEGARGGVTRVSAWWRDTWQQHNYARQQSAELAPSSPAARGSPPRWRSCPPSPASSAGPAPRCSPWRAAEQGGYQPEQRCGRDTWQCVRRSRRVHGHKKHRRAHWAISARFAPWHAAARR